MRRGVGWTGLLIVSYEDGVYFLFFFTCSTVLQEGALGKWYFFVLLMAFNGRITRGIFVLYE